MPERRMGFSAWAAVLCGAALVPAVAVTKAETNKFSQLFGTSSGVAGGVRFYESLEAGLLNFSQVGLKGPLRADKLESDSPRVPLRKNHRSGGRQVGLDVGNQAIRGLSYREASKNPQQAAGMPRVLVLYSYNESPENKANAEFFFKHGYIASANIKFLFMDNGGDASITLPTGVEAIKRSNTGFDCCAFKESLKHFTPADYEYFVLMNASVRGPFYPSFIDNNTEDWVTLLTHQVRGNTKLVGTTVNCQCFADCPANPGVHLQSMILATDKVGMASVIDEVLKPLECKVAPDGEAARLMCIENFELKMSKMMLEKGYNLRSQMLFWKNHNFQDLESTRKKCSVQGEHAAHQPSGGGDTYYPNNYFGSDLSPLELLFFKTNRHVGQTRLDYLTNIVNWDEQQ